jgi:hypothetical protein
LLKLKVVRISRWGKIKYVKSPQQFVASPRYIV